MNLREIAIALSEAGESLSYLRGIVIDRILGRYGLAGFEWKLKEATKIDLQRSLHAKGLISSWAQINTAFAVRNLVEHRDGKVDKLFRNAVKDIWPQSNWGKRVDSETLVTLEKITVEEEDVNATFTAMLKIIELLTEETLAWDAQT